METVVQPQSLPLIGEKAPAFKAETTQGPLISPRISKVTGLYSSLTRPTSRQYARPNL